jgi:hypothetical protein
MQVWLRGGWVVEQRGTMMGDKDRAQVYRARIGRLSPQLLGHLPAPTSTSRPSLNFYFNSRVTSQLRLQLPSHPSTPKTYNVRL